MTTSISNDKITITAEWATDEANYAIRRAHLFTAASGGNLFATSAFTTPFTKTSDYTFKVTWEIACSYVLGQMLFRNLGTPVGSSQSTQTAHAPL